MRKSLKTKQDVDETLRFVPEGFVCPYVYLNDGTWQNCNHIYPSYFNGYDVTSVTIKWCRHTSNPFDIENLCKFHRNYESRITY